VRPPSISRFFASPNLHVAALGDHEVVGLDVPVDDALDRRCLEPLGGEDRDLDGLQLAEDADLRVELAHVAAPDVLHGDVVEAVHVPRVVDLDDVGVVQLGGGARLHEEALDEGGVALDEVLGEQLDGGLALEGGVEGPVDRSHAAFAQLLLEPVGTDLPAGERIIRHLRSLHSLSRSNHDIP
jgi:hypothetical protein